jgi:hypothetical protein
MKSKIAALLSSLLGPELELDDDMEQDEREELDIDPEHW